jgi:hypothetical protein
MVLVINVLLLELFAIGLLFPNCGNAFVTQNQQVQVCHRRLQSQTSHPAILWTLNSKGSRSDEREKRPPKADQ